MTDWDGSLSLDIPPSWATPRERLSSLSGIGFPQTLVMPNTPLSPGDRGQTSMDFVIGVSIFLITIGVVFGMIPSLIEPFDESPDITITADRTASQLAEGMLADSDRPGVLDSTCTFGFFDASLGDGQFCPISYDETESDLSTRLNISSTYAVNVSIKRDIDGDGTAETLCTDGDTVGSCTAPRTTTLSTGGQPPAVQSSFSATRSAFLAGKDVRLVVTVW